MSADVVTVFGRILQEHRGDLYSCEVEVGGKTIRVLAKRSGRLYSHHIRLLPNDPVTVELCPYDLSRGRVVYRGHRRRDDGADAQDG